MGEPVSGRALPRMAITPGAGLEWAMGRILRPEVDSVAILIRRI